MDLVAHSRSSYGSRNSNEPLLHLQLLRATAQSIPLIVCSPRTSFAARKGSTARRWTHLGTEQCRAGCSWGGHVGRWGARMGDGRGRRSAGVVESVLARVLEAFQRRVVAALDGSTAGALAAGVPLARLMAAEAAAPQAGAPAAFFAGRAGDSAAAFVTEVVTAGAPCSVAWVCSSSHSCPHFLVSLPRLCRILWLTEKVLAEQA